MSLNYLDLPDHLDVDSRLLIASKKRINIRKGPSQATNQITVSSNATNSTVVFTPQLASAQQVIIDPFCFGEYDVTVTITATGLGGTATVQSYTKDLISLRQYPMASVMNTLQVTVNNQSVVSQPFQWIHQLSQFQDFGNGDNEAITQSLSPIMPDQSPQYGDLVGSPKSPLNSYKTGGELYEEPRGVFSSGFTTVTSTTGTYSFTTTISEPFFNSLLEYKPNSKAEAFYNVRLMNFNITWLSNLSRIMSLDLINAPNISNVVVNLNAARLHQTWLTTPLTQHLPEVAIRSFSQITAVSNTLTSFNAGETRSVISQPITLSQIPKKMWCYVCDSQTDISAPAGCAKSDTTLPISSASALFGNRPGIMSGMDAQDLYTNCSSSEGRAISFIQDQYWVGSVLAIDPVKLLNLRDDEAPGLLGNYQFVLTLTVKNISSTAIVPNFWIVYANDSILTTDKFGVSNLINGWLTPETILNASKLPATPSTFGEQNNVYGGSGFLDKVGHAFSDAYNYVKDNHLVSSAIPLLGALQPELAPFVLPAANLVRQTGFGNVAGRRATKRQMQQQALRMV